MVRQINPQKQFGHLWMAESDRFEFDQDDWRTVDCSELADELGHLALIAEGDRTFEDAYAEWVEFVYEKGIWLPLEQSCYQGILLPTGQRAVRLKSCPEELLSPLRWFFELCPRHVKAYVAKDFHLLVRIDRARRTGNPDWRPATALPAPETDRAFFRPPVLTFRNYAR